MNTGTDQPEFLTTKEVADLLRIKERKLYDLVSAQEIPCVKATGKLLFPKAELMHWIRTGELLRASALPEERANVIAGSHDPLLEWAVRESQCGLAMQFDGSLSGLGLFDEGKAIATGLHIPDQATGEWNGPIVQSRYSKNNVVLMRWASRQQGLVVVRGNPSNISTLADLKRLRVATRQAGAGGMMLFEKLLQECGMSLADLTVTETCRTENETIAAVASGNADAAPGLQALAAQFGLGFVPTRIEQFDLLVCRKAWFETPFQTLLAFTRSEAFQNKAAQFAGYDTTALGNVVWNA